MEATKKKDFAKNLNIDLYSQITFFTNHNN
jgi:hypothetical protein